MQDLLYVLPYRVRSVIALKVHTEYPFVYSLGMFPVRSEMTDQIKLSMFETLGDVFCTFFPQFSSLVLTSHSRDFSLSVQDVILHNLGSVWLTSCLHN